MAGIILTAAGVLGLLGGTAGFIVSYRILAGKKARIREELARLTG